MTNTVSTTPGTAHQNVVPSEVGWQFVPQYYTFVNKQPNRLHCFYTKNSTFIHGTEGEDGRPCFGQQEIHAKIQALGFQDCKVFIHSVDAQASQAGGIIIQVIGEMSNNGEPWKKFVQTFFLAEQPNGYFVLNDIFRFLKEESVESEAESDADVATADAAAEDAPVHTELQPEEQLETQPVTPPVNLPPAPVEAAPEPAPAPAPETVSPAPIAEAKPQVNGVVAVAEPEQHQPEPAVSVSAPSPPPPATPEPEPAPAPTATPAVPAAVPAAPSPSLSPAVAQPTSPVPPPQQPQAAAAAAPVHAPVAQPAPAHAPAAPKTWANLAAANSKKWGAAVAQESRGLSEQAAPSPPAPSSGTQTPVTQPAPSGPQNRGGAREPHPAYLAATSVNTPQVFVKGVTEQVSHALLTKVLTERFGPLKDLDIVPSKACAFLEFLSLDAARRAIVTSLPPNQGGEGGIRIDVGGAQVRISVDARKERGERPPPRPHRGAPGQGSGDRGGYRGGGVRGGPRGRGGAPSGKAI